MRPLRVRFTVRRLMLAVAVVGISLGLRAWAERWASRFDDLSIYHGWASWARDPRVSAWHRRMQEKYAEAARRPWLPVAADPPEPE